MWCSFYEVLVDDVETIIDYPVCDMACKGCEHNWGKED